MSVIHDSGADLRLKVEKLIWRGRGLAREESGRVVIIRPGVLPGEEVLVRPVSVRRDFIEADPVRILTPSPRRRPHPCPLSEACGGCSYGVLRRSDQLELKRGLVAAEIARGLRGLTSEVPDIQVLAGLPAWRYRYRAQVHVRSGQAHYAAQSSDALVAVADCLLWVRPLAEAMSAICAGLPDGRRVVGASPDSGRVLPEGSGGRLDFRLPHCDALLRLPPDGFFQANWKLNLELIGLVTSRLEGFGKVGDLYSGAGNFALPLAGLGHEVLALEGAPGAVAAGQEAVAGMSGGRPVRFLQADLSGERGFAALRKFRPEALVLDPPRSGAGRAVSGLTALSGLRRLVWVSCDIVNTCRDLRPFLEAGYRLREAHLADMFPQTWHAEVVLVLDREQGGRTAR